MKLWLPITKLSYTHKCLIDMESQKRINPVIMDIHNSIMDYP